MAHPWDPIAARVVGLARPVPLDPEGVAGPTRGQARGPGWRQTTTGLYVPADVDDGLVEQRIVEQGARCGSTGAVTGWASLRLHRAGFFDGLAGDGRTRLAVPLLEGAGRLRQLAGSLVLRDELPESEVVVRYGVRCTVPERAVLDEVDRVAQLRAAVRVIDMACAAELTSLRRIEHFRASHPRRRGNGLAARALPLASEHARSPWEVDLRLVWELDAGWSRPVCNRAVRDLRGRLLGIPDLLDPLRGIVGEYNGAEHRSRSRQRNDVRRDDLFRRAGLECFAVVAGELDDRAAVVERMEATADRVVDRPHGWFIDPPDRSLDDLLDERDRK